MIKLSIIIPVYKTERFVEKCILSCIEQDIQYSEYEVIVINDGSPDNSLSIVEAIAGEYSNIKIVSQKNEGLSAARNKGLELAKGDYVWFIDSDDWIKKNCLSDILDELYISNLDAIVISSVNVSTDGKEIKVRSFYDTLGEKILTGVDLLKMKEFEPNAQFTIYKRDFLLNNNLKFVYGLIHEDSEFTPRAYYFLKKIKAYNKVVYYVFQNPNSITRSVNFKKSFDCIRVANSLYYFSQKVDKHFLYIFNDIIGVAINNGFSEMGLMPKNIKSDFSYFIYQHKHLYSCLIKSSIIKYKIEGTLFFILPYNVFFIYNLLQLFNFSKRRFVN